MSTSWMPWALGGMLAASMAWNLKSWSAPPMAPPSCPHCVQAGPIDLDALGLSDEQYATLMSCCDGACRASAAVEASISEVERQLERAISAPTPLEDDARRLATELGALRARALSESVDAILRVRRVLRPDQLEALCGCLSE